MKKIALVCDDNYITWISHLIELNPKKNFFYIFCINETIQNKLKKLKNKNFKTFLFIDNYKKHYSENFLNTIEKNLNCSFLELKKSIYAYDEFFKSRNFIKNEIKNNKIDQYLCQVYANLIKFFNKHEVDFFFLEQDSGLISFIIKKLCEKNNIKCLLFYEIYFAHSFLILNSSNYLPISKNNKINISNLKKKFLSLKKKKFSDFEKIWQENYEEKENFLIKKYFNKKLDTDFFFLNIFEKVIIKFKKLFISFYFNKINIKNLPKKYVVYYLSYQPEATTYGFGSYGTDQLYLIKKIRENLNQNIHLLIKEHPEQLIKIPRKYSFYNEIIRLKNTHFISNDFDKHLLLKNSKLIFTIAGTIALEAALIEKKVIIFSKLMNSIFKKNISYVDDLKKIRIVINKNLSTKPVKVFFSDYKKLKSFFLEGELYFKNRIKKNTSISINQFIKKLS